MSYVFVLDKLILLKVINDKYQVVDKSPECNHTFMYVD
jgi:hypothetical protein